MKELHKLLRVCPYPACFGANTSVMLLALGQEHRPKLLRGVYPSSPVVPLLPLSAACPRVCVLFCPVLTVFVRARDPTQPVSKKDEFCGGEEKGLSTELVCPMGERAAFDMFIHLQPELSARTAVGTCNQDSERGVMSGDMRAVLVVGRGGGPAPSVCRTTRSNRQLSAPDRLVTLRC